MSSAYPEKSADSLTVLRATRKLRQPAPGFYSRGPLRDVTPDQRARLADVETEAWTIAVGPWRLPAEATP